jgi:tape measure domain-containing protein
MATVDNKVVSLEFNNSRFNSNVQSTMSALDKLKEKLAFKGGVKGFEDINKAAGQVKVDTISRGIEGVSAGFIAMSTIAITALSKITSAAVDTGARLAKAISITPITDGFSEYETKMGSIQTIMSNTQAEQEKSGLTTEEWGGKVTKALQNLNTYSDKTIYNFGEMAKNIGTFTAAGVDLDTSVSSIKGIANIAAISGSNSEQASTAMYQLSQAMAQGSVKLMDWNSVVNAGMGGEVFQKSLFDTGKALGTLKDVPVGQTFDEWKDSGNSFRESLKDEWITTDVLTTTLSAASGEMTKVQLLAKGFTDEQAASMLKLGENGVEAATKVKTASQLFSTLGEAMGSGWSTTFELIFGNFEEAKKLFTGLSNYIGGIINKSADARNLIMLDWKNNDGRDTLMQGMLMAWQDILSILTPVGRAFREVFPKKTSGDLLSMTEKFKAFFENFRLGAGNAKTIKVVFVAFFTAIKMGLKIIGSLVSMFFKVIGAIGTFATALRIASGGAVGAFFKAIGNLFKALTSGGGAAATGALDGLSSGAKTLGTWLGNLLGNLAGVTERINNFTKSLLQGDKATKKSGESTSRFAGIIEFFKSVFSGIGNFFGSIFDGIASFGELIGNVASAIVDALGNLGGGLSNAFSSINWKLVFGGIGVGAGVALVAKLRQLLNAPLTLIETLSESLAGIGDSFANVLNGFALQIKADALGDAADAIFKLAIALAIMTAALVVLASLDPVRLGQAVATMAALFVALNKTMKGFLTLQLPSGMQLFGLGVALLGIAGAIFILAAALKRIEDLDQNQLLVGVSTVAALMTGLALAAQQLAKDTGTMAKAGLAMIGMSIAIYILTFALARMADLDPAKAIAGAVAASAAIVGMAYALKQVDEKEAAAKGLAFLGLGAAVNLFAMAVEKFGNMKLSVLGTGMAAIGALLGGMVLFFNKLPPNMILVAGQILIISIAMNVLAYAVQAMGSMDWEVMKQGLIGIAGALAIMAIAANVMNSAIVGAGAVVIMAVGLTLLAGAVATFGQMGVDTMIKSLLGIAAVLVIIGVAGAIFGVISPLLLAGGVAFMAMGLGMLFFGAGAWLAATAILALAGASAVGVKQAISAINQILKALPGFAASIGKGIIEGVRTILDAIPGLTDSIGKAVWALMTMLIDLVLKFIDEKLDDIIQAGYDILLAFMRGIRDNIAEITMVAAEILVEFLNGLAEAIEEKAEEIGEAGRRLAKALITGLINALIPKEIREKIGELVTGMIDKFKEMLGINSPSTVFLGFGGDILTGLLNGLIENVPKVLTFFFELPGKIITAIGNLLSFLVPKGLELLGGLLTGIWNALPGIVKFFLELPGKVIGFIGDVLRTLATKGKELLGGLLTGLVEKLPGIGQWLIALPGKLVGYVGAVVGKLYSKGQEFLQGLKNGAINKLEGLKTWISGVPGKLITALGDVGSKLMQTGRDFLQGFKDGMVEKLEGIKTWIEGKIGGLVDLANTAVGNSSPSKFMRESGNFFIEGFRIGLKENFSKLESETSGLVSGFTDATLKQLAELQGSKMLDGITPTITPVLDLSMVEAKARTLGDLLGIDTLTTDMSYTNAQQIATTSETSSPTEELGGGDTYLNFVQNNNSPKALSTGDIYRGQKSQIALAKKELGLVNR